MDRKDTSVKVSESDFEHGNYPYLPTSTPLRSDAPHHNFSLNTQPGSGNTHETPKRMKLEGSISDSFNTSSAESIPSSPWEWRKMKAELISLRTRLTHQESTVQQLHQIRQEMEELFQKEKKILQIQMNQDKTMIKQLELRVDVGRKTIQESKAAQFRAEKELAEMKMKMEQKIMVLQTENAKLKQILEREVERTFKPDPDRPEIEIRLSTCTENLELANKRILELEENLREARKDQQKYELQNVELQALRVKVEQFNSEISHIEESKKFTARAAQAYELEKELNQARAMITSLRESLKGKLLLEEQIAHLNCRLQRTENLEKQVSQLEFSQAELLSKLSEYEELGISGGPSAVRREIKSLQSAVLDLTAEGGELRQKINILEKDLANANSKVEETKKLLTDTINSHDRLTRFVSRLQKKMSLVTRERDSYRQQLDSYEKEITAYHNNENPSVSNDRIPVLERTIESYRELVAKLEADIEALDGAPHLQAFKLLKEENEKLKDEIAHRALKGDFNINTKIVHYKLNPAALAEQQAEEKEKALLEEVEQLRTIVSSGSTGKGPAPSFSYHSKEIAEIQNNYEIKMSRLKEAFQATSHEYRQACYQLTGWKIDRTKEGQYKLASQYAESPGDYLFFLVTDDDVNMIETPFSATLTHLIDRYLQQQQSVPMFLNAVQSELFDQQTMCH
ncbi:mitotic spindle assembly checkpoint protein MAD1 [Trichogramma pretiosum]|uniref:mitotic spindle assembly checkpoint protein MAD1 n=1 Tax=Trichogramma pretiosum TaxID=7493 RepID=UPI0006C9BF11|nr:mitotic spindle assembly checkpoint protein MAD1 [Trichogramma pretiosum]